MIKSLQLTLRFWLLPLGGTYFIWIPFLLFHESLAFALLSGFFFAKFFKVQKFFGTCTLIDSSSWKIFQVHLATKAWLFPKRCPTLSRRHVVADAADPHLGRVVLVRSQSWILLRETFSKFENYSKSKNVSGLVKYLWSSCLLCIYGFFFAKLFPSLKIIPSPKMFPVKSDQPKDIDQHW